MEKIDNGGANAIKGFNYQKSVIVLIAVLHYLNENNFQIYVESEDDIVITIKNTKTYMQAKSRGLSLASIVKRVDSKDSILEKNLAKGDEQNSYYKLVTPNFANIGNYLDDAEPSILTEGASIYSYSSTARVEIEKKLPDLSKVKLKNSRVALTAFKANQKDALTYIQGVMTNQGIPVDNSYGRASLSELCNQIDQRSEVSVQNPADYEKKKFTHENLSIIFSHSYKAKYFEDILSALGYSLARQVDLRKKNITVGAIYGSNIEDAKKAIQDMDIANMNEREIISGVIDSVHFVGVSDELDKEAVAINAFSQVLFERSQL